MKEKPSILSPEAWASIEAKVLAILSEHETFAMAVETNWAQTAPGMEN